MKKLGTKFLSFFVILTMLLGPVASIPVTTVLASGGNLVSNGDFSTNDMTSWWSYDSGTGVTFNASSGSLAVTVPSGLTDAWQAGAGHDGIVLVDGATYRLEFTASATPNVSINVMVQNSGGDHTYFFQTVNLTSTPTNFTYTFTADQAEAGGKLIFQVGNTTPYSGTIDDVSLMAIEELLTNGDFATNAMSPWWSYDSGTGVTFDASGGNLAITVPSGLTDAWQAGTGQDGIVLANGSKYYLQFTASATPNVSINVMVQNTSGSHNYIFQTVNLTSTPTTFTYPFTADQDEATGKLIFQVGNTTPYGGIIDNVSLTGPTDPTPPEPGGPPSHIGELLFNGTFGAGSTTPWWSNGATLAVNQKRLEATITNGMANPWDAIVGQADIPVFDTSSTDGLQYTLTLKAWASASMTATAIIQKDGAPYTQYYNQSLALTTTPKTFTFSFDSTVEDLDAVFQIQIGGQGNNVVYLDNVSLNGPEPVTHMSSGTSLLTNGDFADGTNPWWKAGGDSWDTSSGEMVVTVPVGTGNTWDDILGQNNISLLEGGSYSLDFDAYADTTVSVLTLIQLNSSPYTAYFTSPVALTTSTQHFHFEFTAPATDAAAGFQFPLGSHGPLVFHVDNVVLLGPKPTPPTAFLTGVRVNQAGYLPDAPKIASVVNDLTTAQPWTLYNSSNSPVASGTTTIFGADAASGEVVQQADFSSFTTPGTGYYLQVYGENSYPFDISPNIYTQLKYDSLAYFYQTRSGIAISMPYAGRSDLTHPAGHIGVAPNLGDTSVTCFSGPDTNVPPHNWTGCSYSLNVSKGWYDAGDHGKYVVNGGIALWTLLNEYERMQHYGANTFLDDGEMNIPENANGVPDILDEARWEMEFMLSMQVPPNGVVEGENVGGMVHSKISDEFWTGLPMRPDLDPVQRYLYPPTTAATLNMAAVAAQCARIWANIDAPFAAQCLNAAETAWTAAVAHPAIYANNYFNGGGGYGDNDVSDEFYWAASELFITTGNSTYQNYITADTTNYLTIHTNDAISGILVDDSFGWPNTAALGNISLAIAPNTLSGTDILTIKNNIVDAADGYAANIPLQGYGLPYRSESGGYWWGSNSSVLNNALILALAYDFTGQDTYLDAVTQAMDYILGHNPNVKSYISGYGEDPMVNPHHRFWLPSSSGYPVPPPGVLSGGPNSNMDDSFIQAVFPNGCATAPQKCYVDNFNTYSTNEVAINWNAPLAWVTAFLDDVQNPNNGTPVATYTLQPSLTPTVTQTATPTFTATVTATATTTRTNTPTATRTVTRTPTKTSTPTKTATPTVTATPTQTVFTLTLKSIPVEDGWILESTETSGTGGTMDSTATTFRLGDEVANKQYRSILSFNTTLLPDTAVLQSAVLHIKQNGLPTGTDPFTILGSVWADIRTGTFGAGALELADFNSAATVNAAGAFNSTPVSNVYTLTMNAAARNAINATGRTQIRLRFGMDDNNDNAADYMKFLSGDFTSGQPELVITYIVP